MGSTQRSIKVMLSKIKVFLGISIFIALSFFITCIFYFVMTLPSAQLLEGCITNKIYNKSICPNESNYTPIENISENLIKSILISEDASFFQHKGYDLYEIQQSFKKNLKSKKLARGGSTITQQLVKNVYLSKDKTILRKIKELLISIKVENHFSKDQILEKYLNIIEWGPDIFGIKPASFYYFNKSPDALSLSESVFLAFLIPSPKGHHRYFADKKLTAYAQSRLLDILQKLFTYEKISEDEFNSAKKNIFLLWPDQKLIQDFSLEDTENESSLNE